MRKIAMIIFTLAITVAPVFADWIDDMRGAREGESALMSGDYKTAYEKLKPEADKGNPIAQYRLGQMYRLGYGFSQNDREAIKWFRKSAQQGNENAQYELGELYSDEKYKNYKLAARYFRDAAENKHFIAQYRMGTMFRDGKGVIQDYVQAHMWFNIAMAEEKNIDSTRKSTNEIEKKMTPNQIAEAQKMAREWVKDHTGKAMTPADHEKMMKYLGEITGKSK